MPHVRLSGAGGGISLCCRPLPGLNWCLPRTPSPAQFCPFPAFSCPPPPRNTFPLLGRICAAAGQPASSVHLGPVDLTCCRFRTCTWRASLRLPLPRRGSEQAESASGPCVPQKASWRLLRPTSRSSSQCLRCLLKYERLHLCRLRTPPEVTRRHVWSCQDVL